ncbi:MAG TPA: OmpH family outer membrane protein [Vicinamibacterales bacterium]|jgi:Skp family chaperone for outer membrane proteins|nr:OmpH family outer membrane protein [Vicinamibacterales bacterium]
MRTYTRLFAAATILVIPFTAHAQVPVSANVQSPSIGVRIACFSPQQAFSQSEIGKAAIARATALQTEMGRAIDEKNRALQAQEQALNQNGAVLSDSARAQQTDAIQKLRTDVQRMTEDAQAQLTGVQRDAENAFLVKLKPALTTIALAKGLELILDEDEGQAAWFEPSLDITPEVVRQIALK